MQDEHRPVHFQMIRSPGLAAAFNGLRTIMDRSSIDDGVARGSGATWTTAFVAPRQITPQGLGLLCGPIDASVDCLAAAVRSRISTTRRSARASIPRPADHARKYVNRSLVRGSLHAACAIDRLRRREAVNTRPRGVRSAAAPWRWMSSLDRAPGQWAPSTAQRSAKCRFGLFRPPTDANRIASQHPLRS
jgi:hypothetical protein